MIGPTGVAHESYQERELEKVNVFYLQKEAEVLLTPRSVEVLVHQDVAQAPAQDTTGQKAGDAVPKPRLLEALGDFCHARRRLPAVRQRSQQIASESAINGAAWHSLLESIAICRSQRHCFLEDSQEGSKPFSALHPTTLMFY